MNFRHSVLPMLATASLAACNSEPAQKDSLDGATVETSVAEPEDSAEGVAAPAEETETPTGSKDDSPNPYASGRPGQPAIPETIEDDNWQARYSPDVPYYNRTGEPIPATMGASPRTALVGQVQPGEGGFIQTCEKNSTFCKITFGGEGKAGYVNMDRMSGEAR